MPKLRTMLRFLGIIFTIFACVATTYLAWSWYRMSDEVLTKDRSWPRLFPYPDNALLALNDWYDLRNPMPPGTIKLDGEVARVRLTLVVALSISTAASFIPILAVAWPLLNRLRRQHGFEVIEAGTQWKR